MSVCEAARKSVFWTPNPVPGSEYALNVQRKKIHLLQIHLLQIHVLQIDLLQIYLLQIHRLQIHLLQINILQIHLLQIHLLQIHLLQIHLLQINLLQIHVLQIHLLQIHLLQIHVLQIQSIFYKSNPIQFTPSFTICPKNISIGGYASIICMLHSTNTPRVTVVFYTAFCESVQMHNLLVNGLYSIRSFFLP